MMGFARWTGLLVLVGMFGCYGGSVEELPGRMIGHARQGLTQQECNEAHGSMCYGVPVPSCGNVNGNPYHSTGFNFCSQDGEQGWKLTCVALSGYNYCNAFGGGDSIQIGSYTWPHLDCGLHEGQTGCLMQGCTDSVCDPFLGTNGTCVPHPYEEYICPEGFSTCWGGPGMTCR